MAGGGAADELSARPKVWHSRSSVVGDLQETRKTIIMEKGFSAGLAARRRKAIMVMGIERRDSH